MTAARVTATTVAGQETEGLPSAAPIFQTLFGYQATAALGSGISLGIFDALAAGPRDSTSVAAAVVADERGTRILLDALAALGFVETGSDGYRLTPVSQAFLVSDGTAYLGRLANIFYSDWQWEGFLRLADAVQAGGTAVEGQDLEQPGHPFWDTYVHSWGAAGYPPAAALAEILGPWIAAREPFSSLDVACGDGLYSFILARTQRHVNVTLFDQEHVLVSTRKNAEEHGLLDRATFRAGDMFSADLGGPYDLIIVSNVLHLFGQDQCRELLHRLRAVLKPDGRLAIHEFAPDAGPTEDPVARLFSLVMLVRTHTGQTHTLTDYHRLLTDTGFQPPDIHPLQGQPTSLLLSQPAS
jgi:C-methyltransferase